ncbi:Uncharacterized protein BM_BM17412 [Brugia malayi]|uniref:Uncharacterized protein n=1 Tax=Brugia malayi TaxID=6279 RepID=A0A4E9F698_BRUMA|nr:Uncharacterized protein BM_BM17412 [Brugia malayi]VIO92333.1 Uncharacterized protein BM_BM17412 [Brugia malayi]
MKPSRNIYDSNMDSIDGVDDDDDYGDNDGNNNDDGDDNAHYSIISYQQLLLFNLKAKNFSFSICTVEMKI